jgi:hypothetical protein
MTAQAQHKLTWSLGRLSATFQASIEEMKFHKYHILFKEGHKHIAKTVDISTVDDCLPVENYITPELRTLVGRVERAFSFAAARSK